MDEPYAARVLMTIAEAITRVPEVVDAGENTIKTYIYRLRFLLRHLGNCTIEQLDASAFKRLRELAMADEKSPATIESSIKHCSQVFAKLGFQVDTGKPLRVPPPAPEAIPLEHLDAAIPYMQPWLRAVVALGYVTGLRRKDLLRQDFKAIGTSLTVQANKTGKTHRFPIPGWVQRQTQAAGKILKCPRAQARHLKAATTAAGVPYFHLQDLRITSAHTWNRLEHGLGPLILGHSLPGWSGATAFYLNSHDILFERIHDFPAPPSLLTDEEKDEIAQRSAKLSRAISRLTSSKLETLLQVAEGLAS